MVINSTSLVALLCGAHLCWLRLSACLPVCPAVSQPVCGSFCAEPLSKPELRLGPPLHRPRTRRRLSPSRYRNHVAAVINALPPAVPRVLTASLTVCGSQQPASGEMSAVSPEHVRTGEQNRTGDEPELQKAGLLQPQTVFVILDSSETLNLVR